MSRRDGLAPDPSAQVDGVATEQIDGVDAGPELIAYVDQLRDELAKANARVVNLQIALNSSREIGQAVGILMAQYKVTADEGFDLLRQASQLTNRKLRELAAGVVHTGALDIAGSA